MTGIATRPAEGRRDAGPGRTGKAERLPAGPAAVVAGGVLALLAVSAAHLGYGRGDIGHGDLLRLLAGGGDADTWSVLLGGRLPRTLAGLVAGAALAVAGCLLQSSVRNPLASPDTLGVTAGAYLAVTVSAITGFSPGDLPRGGVAFAGGLLAAALVHTVAGGSRGRPAHLVLAGVSVTLALSSVTAVLVVLFQEETGAVFFWGHGSLAVADSARSLTVLPLLAAGLGGGLLLARTLDILGTGDETARGLGVPVGRVRLTAVLLSVLLIAVTGPIGFVGLAAPHLVRLAGVRRHVVLLPAAALATLSSAIRLHRRDLARVTGRRVVAGATALVRRAAVCGAAGAGAVPPRGGPAARLPSCWLGGAGVAALLAGGLVLGDIAVPALPACCGRGGDELLRGWVGRLGARCGGGRARAVSRWRVHGVSAGRYRCMGRCFGGGRVRPAGAGSLRTCGAWRRLPGAARIGRGHGGVSRCPYGLWCVYGAEGCGGGGGGRWWVAAGGLPVRLGAEWMRGRSEDVRGGGLEGRSGLVGAVAWRELRRAVVDWLGVVLGWGCAAGGESRGGRGWGRSSVLGWGKRWPCCGPCSGGGADGGGVRGDGGREGLLGGGRKPLLRRTVGGRRLPARAWGRERVGATLMPSRLGGDGRAGGRLGVSGRGLLGGGTTGAGGGGGGGVGGHDWVRGGDLLMV
ncbi:iron chelate uptake ABC transporter family permease subunit [Streptomyces fradiae]|uniref:iron chelate uptake ABC transporter family permease subunit n=1 Tax=Streptomyces fradiae TaxID=1906 RepID=UPI0020191BB6|nr:iron chelate uptake ABC transporter family permease subunit [Streptomyces fradiae]